MPLPNVSGNSVNPAQNVRNPNQGPNQNPNQTPEQTPGVFRTYAKNLMTTVSENISPTNFVRQGTYNAFGNNAVTRTAMGAMDNTAELLTNFLSGKKDEEKESKTDKLLKEQIKIATETRDILAQVVEKLKPETFAKAGMDETDLHEIDKETATEEAKKTKQDRVEDKSPIYDLLSNVASDVLDIKGILTNGFEKMYENVHDEGGRRRKIDGEDIEDAVIIRETTYSKNRDLAVKNHNIKVEKILKSILMDSDKTVALLSNNQLSTAEDTSESKMKHMGMAEEVGPSGLKAPSTADMDKGSGALIGLLMGAAGFFFDKIVSGVKGLAGKVVEWFKSGIDAIGEAFTKAWDFLKNGANSIVEGAKKAWDGIVDFGKGLFEKAGVVFDDAVKGAKQIGSDIAEGATKMVKAAPEVLAEGAEAAGKIVPKALKAIPGVGEAAMVGLAGYDAYKAAGSAEDVLSIKGRKATTGEKVEAGVGGVVESLSLGFISKESTAKFLDNLTTTKKDKQEILNKSQQELSDKLRDKTAAVAPASAANAPVIVNTENNSYYSGRKNNRNDDDSFNRYLDKHYAF